MVCQISTQTRRIDGRIGDKRLVVTPLAIVRLPRRKVQATADQFQIGRIQDRAVIKHVPARPSSDIDLVVVMGDALDDWLTALRVPLVAAEEATDDVTPRPSEKPLVLIEREEVTRIRVTSSGIAIA